MSAPMPPAQQGQPAMPQNGMGTAALVLGVLGIIGCLPYIGSILGIIFGRIGMRNAEQGLATNGGSAKAGFILGIIGLVLAVIGTIFYFVVIAAALSSNGM